jgi:hypothetical protein
LPEGPQQVKGKKHRFTMIVVIIRQEDGNGAVSFVVTVSYEVIAQRLALKEFTWQNNIPFWPEGRRDSGDVSACEAPAVNMATCR